MKKLNLWIRSLTLSQQLLVLIFFFITFFVSFFFVYISSNVDSLIDSQMYYTLEEHQAEIVAEIKNGTLTDNEIRKTPSISTTIFNFEGGTLNLVHPSDSVVAKDEVLRKYIISNIGKLTYNGETKPGYFKGENVSYYYVLTKQDMTYVVSVINSTYNAEFRNALVTSVINITGIVVGLIFVILILWVGYIIRPLNQIRNYIEKIKVGEDADLKINRQDEIGELADALISMKNDLGKQEKIKEEMIHNISHDLKTPIAIIKSYGESIKDGVYPYDTLEKSVDVIINNAERLEKKVHSLLFLNRVEYLISQDNEHNQINMKQVIEEVIMSIKVIRNDIEIETELEDSYFVGNEESWRVVVENLLENALRYTKSKIVIRLDEDELSIENDGPSISEDRLNVLFKPFEKGQGGQFGLGLSIVAKVVKASKYYVIGENTLFGVIFRISKHQL